jgi:hypothetical protein
MEMARRIFPSLNQADMLERFLSYCEESFKGKQPVEEENDDDDDDRRERVSPRVLRQRKSVTLFPRRTITSLEEDAVIDLYNNALMKRQGTSLNRGKGDKKQDVNTFIRDLRNKTYVPSVLTGMDTARRNLGGDDSTSDGE